MKLINNQFNEEAYTFKTKEGLTVMLVHKPGFDRSLVAYGTNFGSLNLKQEVEGRVYNHKQGLAHFLEHKLFEDEEGDILSQFAKLGANANAFTSFENTVYYFSTTMDIKEPLNLLLKFVNRLKINESSVEKEKGIIIEELKMYDNNPDFNLLYSTYRNVYNTYPLKYDIAGTEESVKNTTLEDLQTAYALNYQPSNMCLVVISKEDPTIVKSWIEANDITQSSHEIVNIFAEEALNVVHDSLEYNFPVVIPKYSVAYKFEYRNNNALLDSFMTRIILELNFSEFDDEFQTYLDEDIISEDFSYHVDLREGFGVIFFFNDGYKSDAFAALIDNKMAHLQVNEADFKQLKNRHYGQIILSLAQYDGYAINLMSAHFKKENYYDYLDEVRNLKYEDICAYMKILRNFNKTFTKMNPVEL